MITISTTSEEEAREVAGFLAATLPPGWSYRIFLFGHEYRPEELLQGHE
jgi:hypothetical protein